MDMGKDNKYLHTLTQTIWIDMDMDMDIWIWIGGSWEE